MAISDEVLEQIARGEAPDDATLLVLIATPGDALFRTAQEVTRRFAPRVFNLCGIINAKSGACSENCRWCAQSRHWSVPGIQIYQFPRNTPSNAKHWVGMDSGPSVSSVTVVF